MSGYVAILPDNVRVVRQSDVALRLELGDSIADIADYCGVTPQTIHYQLRQMGYVYSRTKGWRKR
jgi:DNA-binding CsgD family transcriptional regulator